MDDKGLMGRCRLPPQTQVTPAGFQRDSPSLQTEASNLITDPVPVLSLEGFDRALALVAVFPSGGAFKLKGSTRPSPGI